MDRTRNIALVKAAKKRCRELRQRETNAEKIFWDVVRNRGWRGYKFYRQYPLFYEYSGNESFFIADFYCHEMKLAVELDGRIHEKQQEIDRIRDEIINCLGIRVLRIKNDEIEKDVEAVLGRMANEANNGTQPCHSLTKRKGHTGMSSKTGQRGESV
jgi:very-short-patch-repair endonuclease